MAGATNTTCSACTAQCNAPRIPRRAPTRSLRRTGLWRTRPPCSARPGAPGQAHAASGVGRANQDPASRGSGVSYAWAWAGLTDRLSFHAHPTCWGGAAARPHVTHAHHCLSWRPTLLSHAAARLAHRRPMRLLRRRAPTQGPGPRVVHVPKRMENLLLLAAAPPHTTTAHGRATARVASLNYTRRHAAPVLACRRWAEAHGGRLPHSPHAPIRRHLSIRPPWVCSSLHCRPSSSPRPPSTEPGKTPRVRVRTHAGPAQTGPAQTGPARSGREQIEQPLRSASYTPMPF